MAVTSIVDCEGVRSSSAPADEEFKNGKEHKDGAQEFSEGGSGGCRGAGRGTARGAGGGG